MAIITLRCRYHVKDMYGFNDNRAFIYTQLYKITYKYYVNIFFNNQNLY